MSNRNLHTDHEVHLSGDQLIRLAKGFSRIFWGIPLALFLLAGFISVHFLPHFRLPSYIFGIVLIYWGVIGLYGTGALTRTWRAAVRRLLVSVFLMLYLAPFLYWWKKVPHVTYFALHLFALLFVLTWMLYLINHLVGELARAMNDLTFFMEARLCAWAVIGLMFLPVACYLGYSLHATVSHSSSLYVEMAQAHRNMPGWIQGFFVLPFTLTMAIAWKAKERCFGRLRRTPAASA